MNLFEIIKTANHNLFRNKIRTFLTILAIFVGSFTIILNVAINSGINAFIDEQTSAFGGKDFIMIMPSSSQEMLSSMTATRDPVEYTEEQTASGLASFTTEDLETLKSVDGLDPDSFFSPAPISGTGYYSSDKVDKRYKIQKATIVPPGNFTIPLAAGNLPDDSSERFQIVLEPKYPQALGYEHDEDILGETITVTIQDPISKEFRGFSAEVVGVESTNLLSSSDGAVISHSLYNAIYDFITAYYPEDYEAPTYYIMASFDLSRFDEAAIKAKLEAAGFSAFTMTDMMGMIHTFFDAILVVFSIFGGIALLAAAIGIVNTLFMSVEERTREIGLDKALGMSSGKIFLSFSVEAISLGFWGSAFGIAVAMIIGTIVNGAVHAPGGFLVDLPTLELFKFTANSIIPLVLIIMLIAFIAGTAPAWKAAHKNPIDALRYE